MPRAVIKFHVLLLDSPFHAHGQSNMRKTKHIKLTFLSECVSCALHWGEADPLHTQQNNQMLHGELFPSIPKDNKDSNKSIS